MSISARTAPSDHASQTHLDSLLGPWPMGGARFDSLVAGRVLSWILTGMVKPADGTPMGADAQSSMLIPPPAGGQGAETGTGHSFRSFPLRSLVSLVSVTPVQGINHEAKRWVTEALARVPGSVSQRPMTKPKERHCGAGLHSRAASQPLGRESMLVLLGCKCTSLLLHQRPAALCLPSYVQRC